MTLKKSSEAVGWASSFLKHHMKNMFLPLGNVTYPCICHTNINFTDRLVIYQALDRLAPWSMRPSVKDAVILIVHLTVLL